MKLGELKKIINGIPDKENDRPISLCGSLLASHDDPFDDIDISWIDCSDAILICINEA